MARRLSTLAPGLALVLVAGLLVPSTARADRDPARSLLQEGLYHETATGDLERAVEAYRRVVDEHPGEREAAARALLGIGRCLERSGDLEEAGESYRRILEEYGSVREVRARAEERVEALDERRRREAEARRLEELRRRMGEADREQREAILREAAAREDPRFLPLVREGLDDPHPRVRIAAIEGLAALGDRDSLDRLAELTTTPRADVRRAARRAIEALRSRLASRTGPGSRGAGDGRPAPQGLVDLVDRLPGERRARLLRRLLRHERTVVRLRAAAILARDGEPAGVRALVEGLGAPTEEDRRRAIRALEALVGSRLGYEPAAPASERRSARERWGAWLRRRSRR